MLAPETRWKWSSFLLCEQEPPRASTTGMLLLAISAMGTGSREPVPMVLSWVSYWQKRIPGVRILPGSPRHLGGLCGLSEDLASIPSYRQREPW